MTRARLFTLVLGPVVIVGGLYWLTMPDFKERAFAAAGIWPSRAPAPSAAATHESLEAACRALAAELAARLGAECRVIVRAPFVLGGDLTEHQLDERYREVIVPTSRGLATCYFDVKPYEPVTILMFATDASYQRHARMLDGNPRAVYSGYYQRAERRVVLNASTGGGTLAHELTHALAHFDFPDMPEWFDEGLSSVYEESVFSRDGLQIRGLSNWRLNHLLPAIRQDRLPDLEAMMASRTVRDGDQAVEYAHARYFCLYLQERQLLSHFYRKYRASAERDPAGIESLKEILQVDSLRDVDQDFRRWVVNLDRSRSRPRQR